MALPALRLIPGGAGSEGEPASNAGVASSGVAAAESVIAAETAPSRADSSDVSSDIGAPHSRVLPAANGSAANEAGGSDAAVDRQLVDRLLAGHQAAFEQLYRRHAAFAFNLAVRLQGHSHDVEDLVHDAFLRAHAELRNLRDAAAFKGWLGAIVVSLVRGRLRRGRLLRGLRLASADPIDLESIASPSAGPEVRAELAQVYALLKLMPADERIAWTLRAVERHRLEEVAELTNCSLATAKRRLVRAQRFLDEHFVEPGRPSSPGFGGEELTRAQSDRAQSNQVQDDWGRS